MQGPEPRTCFGEPRLLSRTAAQLNGGSGPETIAMNPETTHSKEVGYPQSGPS